MSYGSFSSAFSALSAVKLKNFLDSFHGFLQTPVWDRQRNTDVPLSVLAVGRAGSDHHGGLLEESRGKVDGVRSFGDRDPEVERTFLRGEGKPDLGKSLQD